MSLESFRGARRPASAVLLGRLCDASRPGVKLCCVPPTAPAGVFQHVPFAENEGVDISPDALDPLKKQSLE